MNQQLPWAQGTIAAACLCIAACSAQSDASSPAAALTWACDSRTRAGQCAEIEVKKELPSSDDEVHHLASKNRFVITYDGKDYGVAYKTKDWLPGFLEAAPLAWHEGKQLLDYANCDPSFTTSMRTSSVDEGRNVPEYSHFTSRPIPIHLNDDYSGVEKHTWFIYPLQGGPANKFAYCLAFTDQSPDGGSHNGAVHGETP